MNNDTNLVLVPEWTLKILVKHAKKDLGLTPFGGDLEKLSRAIIGAESIAGPLSLPSSARHVDLPPLSFVECGVIARALGHEITRATKAIDPQFKPEPGKVDFNKMSIRIATRLVDHLRTEMLP